MKEVLYRRLQPATILLVCLLLLLKFSTTTITATTAAVTMQQQQPFIPINPFNKLAQQQKPQQQQQQQAQQIYTIQQAWADAIYIAVYEMLEDDNYRTAYRNLDLFFPIPDCSLNNNGQQQNNYEINNFYDLYPKKINLPNAILQNHTTHINLCHEAENQYPWMDLFKIVGEFITKNLNKRYGLNLLPNIIQMDTSQGYFETLQQASDNGQCDIVISAVNHNDERAKQVQFQCPYGSSSPGFIRSSLDPNIKIQNLKDINQTITMNDTLFGDGKIKVIVYSDYYESLILQKYSNKVQIIYAFTGDALEDLIIARKAHIYIGDVTDLYIWFTKNKERCGSDCLFKGFDSPYVFGTFVTNRIVTSSASLITLNLLLLTCCVMIVMLLFIY